jgi:hypothetical protein
VENSLKKNIIHTNLLGVNNVSKNKKRKFLKGIKLSDILASIEEVTKDGLKVSEGIRK